MRTIMMAAALALGTTSIAAPVAAQTNSGLIVVTIDDVDILRNSLNNNQVEVLNNFLNKKNLLTDNQLNTNLQVSVPIGIAANVCNTTVALLSNAASGGTCEAKQASRSLNQAILRQIVNK